MMMSTCASVQKVQVDQEQSFLENDRGLVAHSVAIDTSLEHDFCQICEYVFSGLTKWICRNQSTWKQALGVGLYKYIRQGER